MVMAASDLDGLITHVPNWFDTSPMLVSSIVDRITTGVDVIGYNTTQL
jgi:hypothetical protein